MKAPWISVKAPWFGGAFTSAARLSVVLVVTSLVLLGGACSKSGPGSNSAAGTNTPPEPEVPIKITTPARPPASPPPVPSAGGAAAGDVPVGQRVRLGEWEFMVAGPWKDGDGKVIDPVKGPDSYGPDKKFVLVPLEVTRVSGPDRKLTDGNNVLMTYASADPANPKPEDFATNCPYDETWPNKLDLWKVSAASGETLRGNACFIVPIAKTDEFVLGVAPFGQRSGTETYFATH